MEMPTSLNNENVEKEVKEKGMIGQDKKLWNTWLSDISELLDKTPTRTRDSQDAPPQQKFKVGHNKTWNKKT